MNDSIFVYVTNVFSIYEIYLMGGFKSSYLLYAIRIFYHKNDKTLLSLLSVIFWVLSQCRIQKKFGDMSFSWVSWRVQNSAESLFSPANIRL